MTLLRTVMWKGGCESGFTLFFVCLILSIRHPVVSVLVSLLLRLVTARDDTVQKGSSIVASPSSMLGDAAVNTVYTMVFVLRKQ